MFNLRKKSKQPFLIFLPLKKHSIVIFWELSDLAFKGVPHEIIEAFKYLLRRFSVLRTCLLIFRSLWLLWPKLTKSVDQLKNSGQRPWNCRFFTFAHQTSYAHPIMSVWCSPTQICLQQRQLLRILELCDRSVSNRYLSRKQVSKELKTSELNKHKLQKRSIASMIVYHDS